MSISNIGGVSAYNPYEKINSASQMISLPDIGAEITTKGQSKLSEQGIKDKLLDMARREIASGVFSGNNYRSNSAEWLKLEKDYMSFASPDRKGIINNTLSGLAQNLRMMMPRLSLSNNLLGLLMQHNRLFRSRDIGNNFINFRDASGNLVGNYSQQPNGSWGFNNILTNAELSRSHEFMQMWYDAQVYAGTEKRNAETLIDVAASGREIDLDKLIKGGSPIDMAKLAARGITYDAATGQTLIDSEKLMKK